MHINKNGLAICTALLLVGLIFLLFGRAFPSTSVSIEGSVYTINSLTISKDIYYRQTLNNCAPYSVMAVLNILNNEQIDPEVLSKEISWRIYKNLTFPQGLIDLLHKYGIKTKEYTLYRLSSQNKIDWLKGKIDKRTPIILLIEIKHIKHYFTILGYDEHGFMIYDSLQDKRKDDPRKTISDNETYSGNRYYTNEQVIDLWNEGGYKIFFRNWAIVCSK